LLGERGELIRIAVTPDEAAKSLIEWAEKLDISKTGQYWAPRGPSKFLTQIKALC
jgi:hypothetical protein